MDLAFDTKFVFAATSYASAIEDLRASVEEFIWPAVTGIDSPMKIKPSKGRKPGEPNLVHTLRSAAGWVKGDTFQILFGKRSWLTLGFCEGVASGVARLETNDELFTDADHYTSSPEWLVRGLWRIGRLREARTRVSGKDALSCVPRVPIADAQTPVVLTSDAEIASAYDAPAQFLEGWTVLRDGPRILLIRATAIAPQETLRAIGAQQWRMARAAKAGLTIYQDPDASLRDELERDEPALRMVGVDRDGIVEFTSAIEAGRHIPGFDVYLVRELVRRKQLRDGRPVNGARVVFLDREVALAEKRPLLDVGARVFAGDEELR